MVLQIPATTSSQQRLKNTVSQSQSPKDRVKEILSRPNAVNSMGMINPRVVSKEEAGIIAEYKALSSPGFAAQRGPVAPPTPFQARKALTGPQGLLNMAKGMGVGALEAAEIWREEVGLPTVGAASWALSPSVREQYDIARAKGEDPRKAMATAWQKGLTDTPWGAKGLAELIVDPINLFPVLGFPGAISRGAGAGARLGARVTAPIGREIAEGVAQLPAPGALRPQRVYTMPPEGAPGAGMGARRTEEIRKQAEQARQAGQQPSWLTDPMQTEAIRNTAGAEITAEGILLKAARYQKPEQSGMFSIRSGVFYLPEVKSPYQRYYSTGKVGYGGKQKIERTIEVKNPIILKGASGGKVPERAYDMVMGKKGFYQAMRDDVLQATSRLSRSASDDILNAVAGVLAKYGGDEGMASEIIRFSKEGNQLPYAVQENIVANVVRNAGYDAILGYNKVGGRNRLSEVFALSETHYPDPMDVMLSPVAREAAREVPLTPQQEAMRRIAATSGRGVGQVPPGTAIGSAVPPPRQPKQGAKIMGDLSDFNTLVDVMTRSDMWRALANKPVLRSIMGRFNPAAVANSAAAQSVIGRAMLLDQADSLSQVALARLNGLGTQEKLFGKLDNTGLISSGKLRGVSVNDIRANVGKYGDRLSPEQRRWVQVAEEVEKDKLRFLRENGIDIKELGFEEGGVYAGRKVYAKILQNGAKVDAGFVGGAGPGRVGAKMGAEKTRMFRTAKEAIDAGYRYIPDDEALFLNVKAAYKRVADKKMSDWLLDRVPWRTMKASEGLKIAAHQAKRRERQAILLLGGIRRAIRRERLSAGTLKSIGSGFPEEAQELRGLITRLQEKAPRTAKEVKALEERAKDLVMQAKDESRFADRKRAASAEQARRAVIGEAHVEQPAFAGKMFTGPEAEQTAKVLEEALDPKFSNLLGKVNEVNSVARYFALAGDISTATIQLLYLAGSDPVRYAKAMKGFVKAFWDPQFQANYLAQPENMAIIQKYPNLVLTRGGSTEFTEAMAQGGVLRKGPLKFFGEKLVPFQRGFESSMDVAGVEMLKAMDHLALDPATGRLSAARIDDLTQFVNEMRGVTSSARLGVSTVQRQLETASLLAPRYNRAIASLLFDVVRGGMRGDLARKKMGQSVVAIGSLSLAISLLMGDDWSEAVDRIDPRSKTFMTWKIGDQNVGPGTKLRSVLKLIGDSWENPERLKDTSIGWGELEYMKNPIMKFGRGLAAPVIGTSYDLASGKNIIGEPTRGLDREGMLNFGETVVAENMIPIWAQSVLFDGGDPLDRATRGLFEFTGMRAYPRNRLWEADQKWEQELDEYRNIPTDKLELKGKPTRENFRTINPGIDAKLFITGEVTSLRTLQAINAVVSYILAEEIDPDEIKVIQRRKEERERYASDGIFLPRNSVDRVIQVLDQVEQQRGR